MNVWQQLDAQVKRHREQFERVKRLVRQYGGGAVRVSEGGVWRCSVRRSHRAGELTERVRARSAAELVWAVRAWKRRPRS